MFPFSLLIFVLLNLLLRNHAYFLLFLGLVPRYHGADINVHVFALSFVFRNLSIYVQFVLEFDCNVQCGTVSRFPESEDSLLHFPGV